MKRYDGKYNIKYLGETVSSLNCFKGEPSTLTFLKKFLIL